MKLTPAKVLTLFVLTLLILAGILSYPYFVAWYAIEHAQDYGLSLHSIDIERSSSWQLPRIKKIRPYSVRENEKFVEWLIAVQPLNYSESYVVEDMALDAKALAAIGATKQPDYKIYFRRCTFSGAAIDGRKYQRCRTLELDNCHINGHSLAGFVDDSQVDEISVDNADEEYMWFDESIAFNFLTKLKKPVRALVISAQIPQLSDHSSPISVFDDVFINNVEKYASAGRFAFNAKNVYSYKGNLKPLEDKIRKVNPDVKFWEAVDVDPFPFSTIIIWFPHGRPVKK